MNDLVRIQSTKTINVTSGLQHKNLTNPDAHVPDRLKVSPEWPKCTVLIHQGVGEYPAEIINWPTVQALMRKNILTVGEKIAAVTDEQKQTITDFAAKQMAVAQSTKQRKRKSLDDVSAYAEESMRPVPEN